MSTKVRNGTSGKSLSGSTEKHISEQNSQVVISSDKHYEFAMILASWIFFSSSFHGFLGIEHQTEIIGWKFQDKSTSN